MSSTKPNLVKKFSLSAPFNFTLQAANSKESSQNGSKVETETVEYEEIKRKCLKDDILYEDPDFPAENSSVFPSRTEEFQFQWTRPKELIEDPRFFIDGISRFDVNQGEIGDCWFLAAVACLTLHDKLFYKVVPTDNSFQTGEYCGAFHFRFWRFGKWVDIIVDDRLPTREGKLVFMKSGENNEFWPALLEKAYAKLYGSYEALEGGLTSEALEDFTGCVSELFFVQDQQDKILKVMENACEHSCFMGCSLSSGYFFESVTEEGLVRGHAYSITAVKSVELGGDRGKISLIRIRNPWGNAIEWKGDWADSTDEWDAITPEQREELRINFDKDGEFWMSFEDFKKCWDLLEVSHLTADPFQDKNFKIKWKASYFHEGSWVRGGLSRANLELYESNPQYRIKLESTDKANETCNIFVALMQMRKGVKRRDKLPIGFDIYLVQAEAEALPRLHYGFFKENEPIENIDHLPVKQVTKRVTIMSGTYVVVPSTGTEDKEAEFILRIFSDDSCSVEVTTL